MLTGRATLREGHFCNQVEIIRMRGRGGGDTGDDGLSGEEGQVAMPVWKIGWSLV